MKNEEYKKCQLKNLQKQQEDMKVAMLVFTKCARKIIRIHRHFLTVSRDVVAQMEGWFLEM